MLPEAFWERMRRILGEEFEAFREALEQEEYHALRLNPLKPGKDGFSAAVKYGGGNIKEALKFAHLTEVPRAEDGYYYRSDDRPGKHPFHEAGLYYIQEPSAMIPAELLDVRPGERVLDLCAAPGGKSTQAAAKLRGSGLLLCNEIHPGRAGILSENIERMGIVNACVLNETPERLAEFFPGYFDKILVDAPCSGEGMFRRSETARQEWSPENVALCAARQDGILDRAAEMLRPGGRLVYSTCTFAPEENEGSVSRFLRRHEEFELLAPEKEKQGFAGCDGMPEVAEDALPELKNALRLWPHRMKGEGHFAAVLRKAGSMPSGYGSGVTGGIGRGISLKELDEFVQFAGEYLRVSAPGAGEPDLRILGRAVGMEGEARYIRFGDNLYLVSAETPSLKGLKVLRPGLHLGELKKNRFEPSHALALAVDPKYVTHVSDFPSDGPETESFLRGLTFPAEGEKGWHLICADGFGIGWGKLAGGIMKNHYPKGLRKG